MPIEKYLPPSPRALSNSMRDIGYTLETAIADIIDNSISAKANSIKILSTIISNEVMIAIIDNGNGMNQEELIYAMEYGGNSEFKLRDPNDLGRFGLGLKTASFSQCRNLTVISSKNGTICGAEWDLDIVKEKDAWVIGLLDASEINQIPFIEYLESNGTMILWRKNDKLNYNQKSPDKFRELLHESLDILGNHLSLVFHRYMSGEFLNKQKLSISINGDELKPFDPFCKKYSQGLIDEKIEIDNDDVWMHVYIMPHYSRLPVDIEEYYKNRSNFLSNQGIYIYRNGRLMAWGSWHRLLPKGEATKLARIQVDFPSTLDDHWHIDIKKSRAELPQSVREKIQQILPKISDASRRPFKKRARKLLDEQKEPLWSRFQKRDGIEYLINIDNPLLKVFIESLSTEQKRRFITIMDLLASSLPFANIYDDFSENPRLLEHDLIHEQELLKKLDELRNALFGQGQFDRQKFINMVESIPSLFGDREKLVDEYLEGLNL